MGFREGRFIANDYVDFAAGPCVPETVRPQLGRQPFGPGPGDGRGEGEEQGRGDKAFDDALHGFFFGDRRRALAGTFCFDSGFLWHKGLSAGSAEEV